MNTIEKIIADGVTYHLRDAAAARVDNAAVGQTVWDSKTVLDRLCPGFTVTGQAVSCTPAEGYPLAVETALPAAGCESLTLHRSNAAPLTVHFPETARGSYRWDLGLLTRPDGSTLQLPASPIFALPGVNTLSADAGVTTVTGRQDLLTALGLREGSV